MNDISKLSSLISENNSIIGGELESLTSPLRKCIIFLNKIESDYNLLHKNSAQKNESQDSNECPICLDQVCDIHISPCGHMFCFSCVQKLNDRRCPICRNIIIGILEHPEFQFANNNQIPQIQNNQVIIIDHHGRRYVLQRPNMPHIRDIRVENMNHYY